MDEDVPVFEPLYPEQKKTCDHPVCEGDAPGGERLCEDCPVIMTRGSPNECPACGYEIG